MARRSLADTIRAALASPEPDRLSRALEPWEKRTLTEADARGLCAVLAEVRDVRPLVAPVDGNPYATPLYDLAVLFQKDATDAAASVLRERALPELGRLFDLAMDVPDCPAHPLAIACKMFALYGHPDGARRAAAAARRYPHEFLWRVVFDVYAAEGHTQGPSLIDHLRDPLPEGFAGIVLLDLANTLCRANRLERHPFDTPAGRKRLEGFLTDPAPGRYSYAHSAAAALPFVAASARNALAALAMDHPSTDVQMEAAWASAHRGGTAGLTFLARMCLDDRHSAVAQRYLEELGQADRIPPAARDPDFQAMAEMCQWLAHPQEFGEPPTRIELYHTRSLHWVPTGDRRRVWLFKYTYAGHKEDGSDDVGLGMVGSVTFALFGETTAELSPEDAYGLHCCWELEVNKDPRTPKKRTAEAGRKLLGI